MEIPSEIILTLKRLRSECGLALASWAFFEVANGYPHGEAQAKLRDAVNAAHEATGFRYLLETCAKDAVLTISRIIDESSGAGKKDRASLKRIYEFVNRPENADALPVLARKWTPGIGEDRNEELTRTCIERLRIRLSGRQKAARNIGHIKAAIDDIRNYHLAHALNADPARLPQIREIRDGIVLSVCATKDASFAIEGLNWDSKGTWQRSLVKAKVFWDRYERGFRA
ncbi:hypothetical protein [Oricola cellulosilytica]|uniref:HEPN AbiU2-like domain-containing protein n=1 Tax=Oricola cellulosilytica TaxID=1429082 RepID=A0A4V2MNC5_9HYPH|nr:hypothetical protein [Oricola cellulosilytica]TCD12280.1 hypothetical protein E0D97_14745 [Oricola cellulosilytica]